MAMELVVVPIGTDDDGNEIVTFAFRPRARRHRGELTWPWTSPSWEWGMHPFGRHPGVSGIQMGAVAIRKALADAGVAWKDIQFAFGGSYEVDNPDAVGRTDGAHRHPVHRRVQRLRHRRERTDAWPRTPSGSASTTSASRSGWTSTCPARSPPTRVQYACPRWYGEIGLFLTTKFFGMKINKYMHDHGIIARDPR